MRSFRLLEVLRFLAPILLGVHLLLSSLTSGPGLFLDLYLYNFIGLALVISLWISPVSIDQIGKIALSTSILFWVLGSILSTYSQFYPSRPIAELLPNTCYLLMYPCVFIALPRLIRNKSSFRAIEALDATIVGIGLSALGSAFLIAPVMPHFAGDRTKTFFALLFPIADLILVALAFALSLMSPPSTRSALISVGVLIFATSDFLFLALTLRGTYSLGSITDDLWLLGLAFVVEGLWHKGSRGKSAGSLHPVFVALAVIMSATLLAVSSLRPDYLPSFFLIPTVATLLLAFIRMMIALKQSSSIGEERILARTDDLTGLPNRRRFISELTAVSASQECALLLLDLDGFKPINDLYGHEVGDYLLREVARRFSRALPPGSLLARLGGDEFGAIVRGEYETTLEVALALHATLSYPFTISGREISVGVSVGHVANDGAPDLMRRADSAMYEAKRQGIGVWAEPKKISMNS